MTLRVEHGQVAVDPLFVACLGEAVALGGGVGQRLLRRHLVVDGSPLGQGVGHFPEGGLDGLFILGHGDLAIHLGHLQIGPVAAAVEDRQGDPRREAPGQGTGGEETGQVVAAEADG